MVTEIWTFEMHVFFLEREREKERREVQESNIVLLMEICSSYCRTLLQ